MAARKKTEDGETKTTSKKKGTAKTPENAVEAANAKSSNNRSKAKSKTPAKGGTSKTRKGSGGKWDGPRASAVGKALVIVESPTKAKTIRNFLGNDYVVTASMGHIRDLPSSGDEIPAEVKKQPWARLGVNVENNFAPLYVIPEEKFDHVQSLREMAGEAKELYLATDEDREGESISWHLVEALEPNIPIRRLVFHEITKEAINHAMQNTRAIDQHLVRAQETRRILDRLFGYEVSPLLWKKVKPKLSAGRVQSVAVKLLVERERARMRFKKAEYWDIKALLKKIKESDDPIKAFEADLTHVGEQRVATGKDFDPDSGKLKAGSENVLILGQAQATGLAERLLRGEAIVKSIEEKPYTQRPAPPFTTSTLQQEANRKLGLSAKEAMAVAQKLYENGFITYMRTDSTTLSTQAVDAARKFILSEYGKEYLPDKPRVYKTKVKNAQEAHEAIRPAGENFTHPDEVKRKLGDKPYKLYVLIWKRTVASQMADAKGTNTTVNVTISFDPNGLALSQEKVSNTTNFRATGKTIQFPGFLRAYVEGSDDPEADLADKEKILPKLDEDEKLATEKMTPLQHETKPPPRYTEGSLVKELEKLGIGRPSTWASIVDVVLSRDYAFKNQGKALVPTFTAMAVTNLLERHFTYLLNYDFTAKLEDDLDAISRGEEERLSYLTRFYHGDAEEGLKALVQQGENEIDPREVCGIPIGKTEDGREIEVRVGRYGAFLTDGEYRASLNGQTAPDEMTLEVALEKLKEAEKGPQVLGDDPETGKKVYVKVGRFGPYVQLGDKDDDGEKPKMASLLKGTKPEDVDLQHALALLSLPKTLGEHPEDRQPVVAANGKYGPYIKWNKESRSIPDPMSPLTITLQQALELLKQPKGKARNQPATLRELGKHPETEKDLVVKNGRYGPYVTDGEINASLQKDMEVEKLTMEQAVQLLQERAEKIKADGGKKKPKKKTTKKTTKKS